MNRIITDLRDGLQNAKWQWRSFAFGLLAFISDIFQVFGPITLFGLALATLAFLFFGTRILLQPAIARKNAVALTTAFIALLFFGMISTASAFDHTPRNGVLADFIPGIEQFQQDVLSRLARLEETTEQTNEAVAEIRKQQAFDYDVPVLKFDIRKTVFPDQPDGAYCVFPGDEVRNFITETSKYAGKVVFLIFEVSEVGNCYEVRSGNFFDPAWVFPDPENRTTMEMLYQARETQLHHIYTSTNVRVWHGADFANAWAGVEIIGPENFRHPFVGGYYDVSSSYTYGLFYVNEPQVPTPELFTLTPADFAQASRAQFERMVEKTGANGP